MTHEFHFAFHFSHPQSATSVNHDYADDNHRDEGDGDGCSTTTRWVVFAFADDADATPRG